MGVQIDRRSMIKLLPGVAAATALDPANTYGGDKVALSAVPLKHSYQPLEQITLRGAHTGTLTVTDGAGEEYFRLTAKDEIRFKVGGALGRHRAAVIDSAGKTLAAWDFQVDCQTELRESSGNFEKLLNAAVWTMMDWNQESPVNVIRYQDRVYQLFVIWLFDHTLTLKGMKYYWPELKDAVDFFAATQREDGMIWENCYPATPEANYFDWKFTYGNFVRRLENGFRQLRRAPVESHVEQFFVEALYTTWKATGDDQWMKAKLDSAIRALRYATSDPYRWSQKHKLMHRGFTIDTWDYTSDDQQKIGSDCVFVVYPGKSEFGIFFGDNTLLAAACRELAEMLTVAGRSSEADEFASLAGTIQERLDKLSWNGQFYTHWIAENPDYKPDVGVDMSSQVALSNAYSLNRGIAHDKCVAIINTYQRIRHEMPKTSPGEFYGIYPPFEKNFTQNEPGKVWEYVNGGVLTVVAAELALGAFEHGFEEYGGDILLRQKALADRYRGYLPVTLRGKAYEAPSRTFEKLKIKELAAADSKSGAPRSVGWINDMQRDLHNLPRGTQEFHGIPFDVADPKIEGGAYCIGLSQEEGSARSVVVDVRAKANSFYLLHAASGPQATVGTLTIRYSDGSEHSEYVQQGKNIGSYWEPRDSKYNREGPRFADTYRVAWQESRAAMVNLGVYAAGFNNPHPDREIESVALTAGLGNSKWIVLAATRSDAPVFFAPYDDLSSGIPDGWNAGIAWAILEGLAGVKDEGAAFRRTVLAPRWEAVGVRRAEVTVRYPASDGYSAYRYTRDAETITLEFAGSGRQFEVEMLLPATHTVSHLTLDGNPVPVRTKTVEKSVYAVLGVRASGTHRATFTLRPHQAL